MHRFRSRAALLGVGGLLLVAILIGAGAIMLTTAPEPTPTPSPTASPSPTPTPSPTRTPSPSPSPTATPSPTPSPTPVAVCPMNGQQLADPGLASRVPILVQIENNPLARPPSGLNLADLVIEAPVEGDTTRFGAVYMCSPNVGAAVGPVRSVRYFNVDLWQQIRAVTFNFGGARAVLDRLAEAGVPYVNGIRGDWPFFYRAGSWGAPHDVFFEPDAARVELESGGLTRVAGRAGEVRAPFTFADAPALPEGRAVNAIGLSTASFWHFGWEWDPGSGTWLRVDGGAPSFDAVTGDRISARTVLVQVVRQETLVSELDPGGYPRRYQYLVDEGSGVLYVDGRAHDVHWSRPSEGDVTAWTYADGSPMVLPPGRVWWEIVPAGSAISEG